MRNLDRRRFIKGSSALGALGASGCLSSSEIKTSNEEFPPALLLTWQRDPTSTMTIDWHVEESSEHNRELRYREDGEQEWSTSIGAKQSFEIYRRDIYRVELTGLEPDTEYEFRFDEGPIYRFSTMPSELDDSVTFAVGGDTDGQPVEGGMFDMVVEHPGEMLWQDKTWSRMAAELMEYSPDFMVIAGDLAYANGASVFTHEERWINWLDVAKVHLIDDDNKVLPIICGIGNHECRDGYYDDAEREYRDTEEWREWFAPYFYNLFAFPGHPGYGVLDFSDYISIFMLDTNHTNPIEGSQTEWLEREMPRRGDTIHIFPMYHVPAYPAHRDVDIESDQVSRKKWIPVFEDVGVDVAFEHHEHMFKKTKPLRRGEEDYRDGVIYMGDGALGKIRNPEVNRWYIDRAMSSYNVHIVTVTENEIDIQTIDDKGREIDQTKIQ